MHRTSLSAALAICLVAVAGVVSHLSRLGEEQRSFARPGVY